MHPQKEKELFMTFGRGEGSQKHNSARLVVVLLSGGSKGRQKEAKARSDRK